MDHRNSTRMTAGSRLATVTTNRGRRRKEGATTAAAFALTCLALCLARSTSLKVHSDGRRGSLFHGIVDSRTSTAARLAGNRLDSAARHGDRLQRLRLAKFDDDDGNGDDDDDDDEYLEKFDLGDLASDVQITAGGTDRSMQRAPAVAPSSPSDADEMRQMMERQQSQIDALMSMMMNQHQQQQGQQTQQQELTSAPRAAPQGPGPSVAPLKAFLFIDGTWLYYSMHTRGGDRDPIERKFGKGWRNHYKVDW